MLNTRSQFRRLFLPIASGLAMLALTACDRSASEPKYTSVDYNVILISIDTLRADHLGTYGYSKKITPHIDSFAKDSIVFKTAIAHAPSTLPSHASIFTGMLPVHHGAFAASQSSIKSQLPTLPEIMRDSGFRTAGFSGGGLVAGVYGFSRGFEQYIAEDKDDRFQNKVDAGMDWIDGLNGDKFFLFLHTYEVHEPFTPDPVLLSQLEKGYSGSLSNSIDSKELAAINRHDAAVTAKDIEHVINLYDAEILSMDTAFGNLVSALKERGIYDNTMIILTSDHGEEFGEHGSIGRHFYTLYDELLHVPLIIKMPNALVAGKSIEDQVRGIDIFPTILDALAISYESQFDGTSVVPIALGDKAEPLIAISQQDTSDKLPPTSIRTNAQKLILRPSQLGYLKISPLWVKDKFEIESDATTLTFSLAAADAERDIEILVDGGRTKLVRVGKQRENIFVLLQYSGQPGSADEEDKESFRLNPEAKRKIVIKSTAPCVDPAAANIDTDLDCVSFALFDPQEYYLLSADPAEQLNLYEDAAYGDEINSLRDSFLSELRKAPGKENNRVEIDDETRKQLESLGYLN